ncbi:MAG TPA: LuxR C-terminal-related transcriptional regulator [Solirubrobacteraceae bacterium]|jgi:PAS domain S-box-containing protein|nr:LuxR C-terminal-related transcriptional regulator [Solirubrobacteraceae bacterium]
MRENALSFSPIFEQSSIPIAVLDSQRRIVDVNQALVRFYDHPRERLIGTRGGPMIVEDPLLEGRWARLLREGRMFGERDVEHADGSTLRVSFAAHVTPDGDAPLVIVVALSVRRQDGAELIGSTQAHAPGPEGSKLTAREREVVRLVALGGDTRAIASQLCLSTETVRTHVRNAMVKTDCHTRAQLVAKVLSEGLAGNGA